MSHEPTAQFPRSHSGDPLVGAGAVEWPVLARLPLVGNDQVAQPRDREAPAEPPARDVRLGRNFAVPGGEAAVSPPVAHRMHRIDAGRPWGSAAAAGGSHRSHLAGPMPRTMSARLFQWRLSMGPHVGVAMTLALVASAAALCWPNPSPTANTPARAAKQSPWSVNVDDLAATPIASTDTTKGTLADVAAKQPIARPAAPYPTTNFTSIDDIVASMVELATAPPATVPAVTVPTEASPATTFPTTPFAAAIDPAVANLPPAGASAAPPTR